MDRVERTERPGGGNGTCGFADATRDFPQLAAGPDRGYVTLGAGEPLFGGPADGTQSKECSARLDQGETRGYDHSR